MRYQRQIVMKEIGREGQEKLEKAKVLVVGAGGLGSPLLTYLVCAGVGNISIVDIDTVSESNLNRQFLHTESDIGLLKVKSAYNKLHALNSEVNLMIYDSLISRDNARDFVKDHELVVACLDNIDARMALNEACLEEDIPLVNGAIHGFHGNAMVITRETACLECIRFQDTVLPDPIPVLGATAGIIGSMQATMAIKLILGIKEDMGKLFQFDGRYFSLDEIEIKINDQCELHRRCSNE